MIVTSHAHARSLAPLLAIAAILVASACAGRGDGGGATGGEGGATGDRGGSSSSTTSGGFGGCPPDMGDPQPSCTCKCGNATVTFPFNAEGDTCVVGGQPLDGQPCTDGGTLTYQDCQVQIDCGV